MANPMRGEAALGDHKLVVTFNRFCTLEGVMDMKVPGLIAMMKTGVNFGFGELRTFVRVFLDKEMSDTEVGDLIETLGMTDIPVPKELRRKGDPDTQQVWLAAHALGEAVDMFLAPLTEKQANPRLAA